ncbi:MFS transporter [Tenggerimyces flavus]|uniref:MFS transporter n=1 Tax=Tenggerimyces flavus TaxID=1708749 RepID=A0ABV7YFY8_9ACTN|nr:MFS transporter [Tenggerimyces flavus]MBM7787923.1 MFS family permease [Tenggerimyces flavus]
MLTRLVLATASMNVAMAVTSAMSTLVVADRLNVGASGLPNTAAVLGTAAGALAVGRLTDRLGRAGALRLGYATAAVGGGFALFAAAGAWLGWLFVGMAMLGAGNASALLSRYAAAELAKPDRRTTAMGTVVGGGAAGAVLGPLLLEPARHLGLGTAAGPFVVATVAAAIACAVTFGLRNGEPERESPTRLEGTQTWGVRVGGVAMLVTQLVMVLFMTAVPIHASQHGQGLTQLGVMLSIHILGMSALAPLTGWWIDRAGPRPAMLCGLLLLSLAGMLMAFGHAFVVALFVLGYGWNLCYLGGSAVVFRSVPSHVSRSTVESALEAVAWGASALATATSTWLFAIGGFGLPAALSLFVIVGAFALILAKNRRNSSCGQQDPTSTTSPAARTTT